MSSVESTSPESLREHIEPFLWSKAQILLMSWATMATFVGAVRRGSLSTAIGASILCVIWTIASRVAFNRRRRWYFDHRGVRGYGLPRNVALKWEDVNQLQIHFPTFIRLAVPEGDLWLTLTYFNTPLVLRQGLGNFIEALKRWGLLVEPEVAGEKPTYRWLYAHGIYAVFVLWVTPFLIDQYRIIGRFGFEDIALPGSRLVGVLSATFSVIAGLWPDKLERSCFTLQLLVVSALGFVIHFAEGDLDAFVRHSSATLLSYCVYAIPFALIFVILAMSSRPMWRETPKGHPGVR